MSALVMADEVKRFAQGEAALAKFCLILAIFLWPLSFVAVRILVMLFLGLSGTSAILVTLLILGVLVFVTRLRLARLRARTAQLEELYLSNDPERLVDLEARVAATAPVNFDDLGTLGRIRRVISLMLLSAPTCTARVIYGRSGAVRTDEQFLATAQQLFEALGVQGDAWAPCSQHEQGRLAMAALERFGLTEHRLAATQIEVRLTPDTRRHYFPKDPSQGFFAGGPPRRR